MQAPSGGGAVTLVIWLGRGVLPRQAVSAIQRGSVFYLNKSFINLIRRAELVMDGLFCSNIVTVFTNYKVVILSYINIHLMI